MAAVLKTAGAQALVSSNLTRSAKRWMLVAVEAAARPRIEAVSSRTGDCARTRGIPPARSTADRSSVAEPSGRGPGRGHSACAGGRGPSACSPGRGHSACVERLAWVAAREAQPRPAPSPRGRNPIDRFSGRCSSRQRMHRPDRGQSPRPRPATRVPSAGSASCDPPRALRHKWPGVIERGPAQGASCARGWLPPSP